MHIEPDNILVSCSIALLLGGWSFLVCYFLLNKFSRAFYLICVGVAVYGLYAFFGQTGSYLLMISWIIAIFSAIIHSSIEETDAQSNGCFSFFGLYFVASQLPSIMVFGFGNGFINLNSTISPYFQKFGEFPLLLMAAAPSLGLIPLYMFKTYRPRLGMDTHFPDAGNN